MRETWSAKVIILTLGIAFLYVTATIYLMNAGLVKDTVFGAHALAYKRDLLLALLLGMWTAMSTWSLILLMAVGLLTGANLTLTAKRLRTLRFSGKTHLAVGGSSLLGMIGSGCASCGLPLLTFFSLGSAAASLPFRGVELSVLAVMLLSLSLYVLLKDRKKQVACALRP